MAALDPIWGRSFPPADPREALVEAADIRGEPLSNLSAVIGRSRGYLARYVRQRTPAALPDLDRQLLAKYLGIDQRILE